jgi:hypothetical protein
VTAKSPATLAQLAEQRSAWEKARARAEQRKRSHATSKTAAQLDREIAEALGSGSIRDKYRRAKASVDGRMVRGAIPNRSSIGSSLTNYEVLPHVREVPLSAFTQMGPLSYYSISEEKRTKDLAAQILRSGEITPLIVVEDAEGPYILEGGHRFDALRELGARALPALVVLDLDSLGGDS